MAAARAGHTNGGSLRIMTCINLVSRTNATGASNEHLAVVVSALIAPASGMLAASQDR
jgi:hypothetical protein